MLEGGGERSGRGRGERREKKEKEKWREKEEKKKKSSFRVLFGFQNSDFIPKMEKEKKFSFFLK